MPQDQPAILRLLMDDRFSEWIHHPTPELDHYWEQWLLHHPEEQSVVEQARQTLQHLDFNKSQYIPRESILAIAFERAESLENPGSVSVPSQESSNHRALPRYWYRVAAALIGVALLVGYWYYLPTDQVHTTTYGESKNIVLPDGSTVILNANSELRYEQEWNEDEPRQVTLAGEAFFSVSHQSDHQKFIVWTNALAIEVLGTEFNVNHRRNETEVMLQQGSVRLDWSADEHVNSAIPDTVRHLTIEPGELVVFSADKLTRKTVNPDVYSAWTDNEWLFEQTPLAEVIAMIEDNYGYHVVAPEALVADKVFTAEIHDADLELLLTFLSESFDLTITKHEKTINIQNRKTTDV